MFCPSCGKEMNDGAKFCSNCGWSEGGGKVRSNKFNVTPKTIITVIAIVALIFFAKNLFFGGGNKTINKIKNVKVVSSYRADTTVDKIDTVKFGLDEDGEPIEWIVLEKNNNKALLLSKYVLEFNTYNNGRENITWENCSLRKWLNSEYINTMFSKKDQDLILTIDVINNDNAQYGTKGGNNTKDKLYLLSIDEVNKYLSTDNQRVTTLKNGVSASWWLRSPGHNQYNAASVAENGDLDEHGYVVFVEYAVRPALWVKYE